MCVYYFQQAKPIVDTIQEHEKYGNTGDQFYGAGRALINTYEGFANLINKVIDVSIKSAAVISHYSLNDILKCQFYCLTFYEFAILILH